MWFARDAGEFLEHVKWACAHREEARARAAAVRQVVLKRHTIDVTDEQWPRLQPRALRSSFRIPGEKRPTLAEPGPGMLEKLRDLAGAVSSPRLQSILVS